MKKCSNCKITKSLNEFHKQKSKPDGLRSNCKSCRKIKAKKYYKENKEEILTKNKKYYKANSKEIQLKNKVYWDNRYKTDINFKLGQILRKRLNGALKNDQKTGSAVNDLGCSVEELKKHLESKFIDGMNWGNYGEWHIDHIRPLCSFNLEEREELLKACNYMNLQPLWYNDNISKGGKYES